MIRTRKNTFEEINIEGSGPFIIAMSADELELIGSLLGMVRLGKSPYQLSALNLIDVLEKVTGDREFTSTAISAVMPVLEVLNDSFEVVAVYGDDNIFEFVV